jgi:hypothetical protein
MKGKRPWLNMGSAILINLLENQFGFNYSFCMTEEFSEMSNALRAVYLLFGEGDGLQQTGQGWSPVIVVRPEWLERESE